MKGRGFVQGRQSDKISHSKSSVSCNATLLGSSLVRAVCLSSRLPPVLGRAIRVGKDDAIRSLGRTSTTSFPSLQPTLQRAAVENRVREDCDLYWVQFVHSKAACVFETPPPGSARRCLLRGRSAVTCLLRPAAEQRPMSFLSTS